MPLKSLQILFRLFGSGPVPRRRRSLREVAPLAAEIQILEDRLLLSSHALDVSTLQIGGQEAFVYVDQDGDAVEIRIHGTSGRVDLYSQGSDGRLRPLAAGERLAVMRISGASSNFRIELAAMPEHGQGNGRVSLGRIEAPGQIIAGVFGPEHSSTGLRVVLESFEGAGFSAGGGLRVDALLGNNSGRAVLIEDLSSRARIEVRESVLGRIVVNNHLAGRISIGGTLAADLVVGGDVPSTARVDVGGTIAGNVRILGRLAGRFDVGGDWNGGLMIAEGVMSTARLQVGGSLRGDVQIVGSMHGTFTVGRVWSGNLMIGQTYGSEALIRTGLHFTGEAQVLGMFYGDVHIGGRAWGTWTISETVAATASLVAGSHWDMVRVGGTFFGQLVAPGNVRLEADGHIGSTARLNSAVSERTFVTTAGVFHGAAYGSVIVYLTAHEAVSSLTRVGSSELVVLLTNDVASHAQVFSPWTHTDLPPARFETPGVTGSPFVISQSGYYRLTRDLVYTAAHGAAIEIRADNVTLDLAGHAVVGTAGSSTGAIGILAQDRTNVRIVNGSVRGFQFGIQLVGQGNAYSVERVRLESNWYFAIWLSGSQSQVRNNQIVNTGGSTFAPDHTVPIAIRVEGSNSRTEANVVAGMWRSPINIELLGLHVDHAPASVVADNLFIIGDPTLHNSWGSWANAGSTVFWGLTNVQFVGNVFADSQYAVSFARAEGTESGSTAINVMMRPGG